MGNLESIDTHFSSRSRGGPASPEVGADAESEDRALPRDVDLMPLTLLDRIRAFVDTDLARWLGVALLALLVVVGLVLRRDGRSVDELLPMAGSDPVADTVPTAADGSSGVGVGASASSLVTTTSGEPAVLVVHVAGQVTSPGLVEVPAGSRVADAIAAAGGAGAAADLDRLNLAAPLADGQRVDVAAVGDPPERGGVTSPATPSGGASGSGPNPAAGADNVVNINTANETELEELPGVGPATAASIVAYRDANGPFRRVDDLLEVKGIGPAKLEAMAAVATVGP